MKSLIRSLAVIVSLLGLQAGAYTVPQRMEWWYQARFGMFIHFGSYSNLGRGEWAFSNENWSKGNYQTQVSAGFNPANFNAAAIVDLAKTAGMKYLVITAKHHEGYAMWNSSVPSFTDVTGTKTYDLAHYSNFPRDILGELKAECDAKGIKFCLYYSILDWNHPSQVISRNGAIFSTMSSMAARTAYIADMKAHLADLIARYDPAIMWFDGDWCPDPAAPTLADWWTAADGADLYNFLIGLKPDLIVNERVKRDLGLGDFSCPEQQVPGGPLSRPWETNATMNSAWGYDSGKENSYKSVSSMVRELVQVVSRDGNYLLNIGPKGDGSVTQGSINILNGMGAWTSVYGESIYGTTASPYSTEPGWGYFTKKPGKLYAHVHSWPSNGQLVLAPLKNAVNRIYSLAAPATSLAHSVDATGNIVVAVPATAPNAIDSVIVVEVTGVPAALASRITTGGTASASAENSAYNEGVDKVFDGNVATKWFTGVNGGTAWLQYQFANGWGWTVPQYQLASANDVPERDPKSWQLLGSNDGGNWSVLDSQSAQSFSGRRQMKTYTVASPGNYRFYRLNITANNGGSAYGIQLSEFNLTPAAPDFEDTTAPAITTQGNLTVAATGPAGAVVNFAVTATDAVNGSPTAACSPPSGSVFPVGATFVQCSATDFAGNTATASFHVSVNAVVDPPQVISPQVTLTGTTASISLESSIAGRNYQLQRSYSLNPGTWQNLGEPQSGGSALEFTDATVPPEGKAFYRLWISP